MQDDTPARDRLLLAAAELLEQSGDRTASTRAVCERAGVTAPTLYHHFGSKQGLLDAVLNHGFTQYVSADESDDPLQDVRDGWDSHVRYGLDQPSFYALLYGRVRPGRPCAITGPAEARLRQLLDRVARHGGLTVPVAEATARIAAANVGVTLSLIAQPESARELELSEQVREAILASVTTTTGNQAIPTSATTTSATTGSKAPTRRAAAITLAAALDEDASGLSAGEALLLRELLTRLSQAGRWPAVLPAVLPASAAIVAPGVGA